MTLKEFREKFLGKQVEFHSYGAGAYNQCVDLVNMYINLCLDNDVKDYTEIIGTNAKDFKDKYDPDDFDFIANDTSPNVIPEEGDIVIWNGYVGSGAGHVAICLEANDMNIHSLDQNWSVAEYVTEEDHTYKNVSGWLRPKKFYPDILELENKIEELEETLEAVRVSRDKWKMEFSKLEDKYTQEVSEKQKHIDSLQKTLSEMNTQLLSANKQIQVLDEAKNSLESKLGACEGKYLSELEKYKEISELLSRSNKLVSELNGKIKEMEIKLQSNLEDISFWEFIRIKLKRKA